MKSRRNSQTAHLSAAVGQADDNIAVGEKVSSTAGIASVWDS
jgi:hypothetical protein